MSKSPLWSAPWTLEARVFATKAELSVEEEAAALGDDAWLLESSRVALDGVAASTTLRSLSPESLFAFGAGGHVETSRLPVEWTHLERLARAPWGSVPPESDVQIRTMFMIMKD